MTKKLFPPKYVKYLGIYTDPNLYWSYRTDILSAKLSHDVGVLSKIHTSRYILWNIFIIANIQLTIIEANSK